MRIVDLIEKKKTNRPLSKEEILFAVNGFMSGEVADYQMSAFLMAVCLKGMTDDEIWDLTSAIIQSGSKADLTGVEGIITDKHSTGGVGDKVSFVALPIAAACGLKVAKMSGRGLGFTGGTADKLEAIPHYRTGLPMTEFVKIVNSVGLSMITQSDDLCPADKKIYALRDVTGTVDSLPLIVSSIMSKKLATGADCLVLDVKTGSGSFCPKIEDAVRLAEKLIFVGKKAGKKVSAIITDMEQPLGCTVGNALEVNEAVAVLKGKGPQSVKEVSLALAAEMLFLADNGRANECKIMAEEALKSGAAFEKFKTMVRAHGGDADVWDNNGKLPHSSLKTEIKAPNDGFVCRINAAALGNAALLSGAGRIKKDDKIDSGAGLMLHKTVGDFVVKGESLATLYYSKKTEAICEAAEIAAKGITVENNPPEKRKVILKVLR